MRTFEFFGGVTELVIPDNPKTGVKKARRCELDLNSTEAARQSLRFILHLVPSVQR
jgi:transposase